MALIVQISVLACLLAAVSAQYSLAPVAPTVAYTAAPHYAVSAVPVAHAVAPVAHYPLAHAIAPVAHVAHVVQPAPFVRILSQTQDSSPDGSYTFGYQSEDGSSRSESGVPKFASQPGVESFGGVASQGSYSYTSPEGGQVEVQYTADENGFQPSGSGVHPAIVKAVEEQVAQAKAEGPIPPAPAARVVAHVPVAVPHYPVAHVAVPHYPVAHVAVPHYPVAHLPVSVPAYVSSTAAPLYASTVAAK